MKSILPWAVVVAAMGGAIWWALARDSAAGKWLLGGLLLAHGLVHLLFAAPEPEASGAAWPFAMDRSWAITSADLSPNLVRAAGWVLIIITVVGFALAALTAGGIVVPSGWWQPTVVTASVASALVLIVFFNAQLILGLGIDAALVSVAIAALWTP